MGVILGVLKNLGELKNLSEKESRTAVRFIALAVLSGVAT
jgi:hypothetical protein